MIGYLTTGGIVQKISRNVDLSDDLSPLVVTGYWVRDILRIDIKVKKE